MPGVQKYLANFICWWDIFFKSLQDLAHIETVLNEELRSISLWLPVNKLSFNVKKDPFIIFKKKEVL